MRWLASWPTSEWSAMTWTSREASTKRRAASAIRSSPADGPKRAEMPSTDEEGLVDAQRLEQRAEARADQAAVPAGAIRRWSG